MKLFSIILVLLLFSATVFAGISQGTAPAISVPQRSGANRISNYDPRLHVPTIDQSVTLLPTYQNPTSGVGRGGRTPYAPRASARLHSVTAYGYSNAQVNIKTKDLPPTSRTNGQYEAWLVDDDSGYRLSLGTFTTIEGGVAELLYSANLYINQYDAIEITLEPLYDTDVSPGPLMLYAFIKPQSINAPLGYKIDSPFKQAT